MSNLPLSRRKWRYGRRWRFAGSEYCCFYPSFRDSQLTRKFKQASTQVNLELFHPKGQRPGPISPCLSGESVLEEHSDDGLDFSRFWSVGVTCLLDLPGRPHKVLAKQESYTHRLCLKANVLNPANGYSQFQYDWWLINVLVLSSLLVQLPRLCCSPYRSARRVRFPSPASPAHP